MRSIIGNRIDYNVGSCCVRVGSGVQTDATTPNNVGPGVVGCVLAVVCKRMQLLPTTLGQQCWELLRPFALN